MTALFRRRVPQFVLVTAWHRGSEATAFIDTPRRCWSPLEVQQIWGRKRDDMARRGLSPWFARIEFPDGGWSWLADYRGTLRNGNGNGHEPLP